MRSFQGMNKDMLHAQDFEVRVPVELRPLLSGFFERRKSEAMSLEELLSADRYSDIARIGHKLKGSGRGYGFEVLSVLGERLEVAAWGGDENEVKSVIQNYVTLIDEIGHLYL